MECNQTHHLQSERRIAKNIPLIDEAEKWMLPKSVFYADGDKGRITVATLPWKNNPRMIWVQDFEGNRLAELSPITEMKPDYSNDIYHNNNTEAFDFSFLDFHIEKQIPCIITIMHRTNYSRPLPSISLVEKSQFTGNTNTRLALLGLS